MRDMVMLYEAVFDSLAMMKMHPPAFITLAQMVAMNSVVAVCSSACCCEILVDLSKDMGREIDEC